MQEAVALGTAHQPARLREFRLDAGGGRLALRVRMSHHRFVSWPARRACSRGIEVSRRRVDSATLVLELPEAVARIEGNTRIDRGACPGGSGSGRRSHRVGKDDPSGDHALFKSVSFHQGFSDCGEIRRALPGVAKSVSDVVT
jgi:hypothetical protein